MDIIEIKDLELFAYHGVMPEENVVGQKFCITARLFTNTSAAGISDDINKSINYADVCNLIKNYVQDNTFKLIEAVAEGIADMILQTYNAVEKLSVEVKKPWAPVHMPVDTVSVRIERSWHTAYLSLGSNMGDKKANLDNAISLLNNNNKIKVIKVSDYIVTAPVGYTDQDDFLNCAIGIKTLLEPDDLLSVIHSVEAAGKRERLLHWGPRTIDVDIILYDNLIIDTDNLHIPHIEAVNREFVLKPLSQIAPYSVHPIEHKTVKQLLDMLYKRTMNKTQESIDFGFEKIDKLKVDKQTKVAFFGVEGTYSQQAMEYFFGEDGYQSYALPKFVDVMKAVHDGKADYGVVPIENSSTGGITDIYDHMLDYDIFIVGEQIIKIDHALLGIPGSRLNDIKVVYSHTQGLRQCSSFFESHPEIKPVEVSSTAAGAQRVLEDGDASKAAIAAKRAAKVYGLDVLLTAVNEQNNNSTRFIIISAKKQYISSSGKISISFETKHESGALYRILSHFNSNGINLEKIESRPIPGRTWEYRFFVDIDGRLDMQGVKNALASVAEESEGLTIIGNF